MRLLEPHYRKRMISKIFGYSYDPNIIKIKIDVGKLSARKAKKILKKYMEEIK